MVFRCREGPDFGQLPFRAYRWRDIDVDPLQEAVDWQIRSLGQPKDVLRCGILLTELDSGFMKGALCGHQSGAFFERARWRRLECRLNL